MLNSVPVGFLGQVDLEKHILPKIEKLYEQWKYIGRPRILLSSFSGSRKFA